MARPILRSREINQIRVDVDNTVSDSRINTSITFRATGDKSFSHTTGHSSSDKDVGPFDAVKVTIRKDREEGAQRGDWGFLVKSKPLDDAGVDAKMNDEIIEGGNIYTITRIRYGPSKPFYFFEVAGR